jgi:predicted dehydrogenase
MAAKLRWGILGCARIAEKALVPAIRESANGVLAGIASRDPRRAADWAKRHGFERVYRSYRDLLADPAIDAVYNPLPNDLHAPWTIAAARAGKHVLCEKPLALTAAEARRMFAAARRARVLLMEAFMYRFHPQLEIVQALVASGEVGEPRVIRASFTFPFEGRPDDYRWSRAHGGGALYDVGCYTINAARTILGAEPVRCFAAGRFDPRRRVDLTVGLILEFPRGRLALLDCSYETQFQSELAVVGREGRITLDRAFSAKRFDVEVRIKKGDEERAVFVHRADQYRLMVEHFGRGALEGFPLRLKSSDALGNMAVLDAAFASLRSGRPVRVARGR